MNSYWIDSFANIVKSEALDKDIETDVCIVGGGVTGISCAYYLAKAGLKVAVLEKDKIACKTAGNTTAKITSQHGLFYKYLVDSFSKEYAKSYLQANENAISNIKQIIDSEGISCDFSYQDAFTYTKDSKYLQDIKDEVDTLNNLNFPAEFVNNIPLKLEIQGAIKFPKQAQFHPRKYISGLCNSLLNSNGKIYENTKVYDVKKEGDNFVTYTKNNKVHSHFVIIATNYPILNFPGFYFLKMYQEKSYVIAIETKEPLPEGMYISKETPTLSFRSTAYQDKKILLIAGNNHKTGEKIDLSSRYTLLEKTAKSMYPDCKILYKWSTQDSISLDKVPYIGHFSKIMPNLFVATGFKKWGMTSSNIAANLITDNILGKENPYEKVFKATRLEPIKNKDEMKNMIKQTTSSLIIEKFKLPDETLKDLKTEEGKIIEVEGHKVGVYKDKENHIYQVTPVCSHLGCELSWNNLEKTWDCPCHGSRFDYKRKFNLFSKY